MFGGIYLRLTFRLEHRARVGVALAGFAHNPQAVLAPNGSILLFHIGSALPAGCLNNCTGAGVPDPVNNDEQSSSSKNTSLVLRTSRLNPRPEQVAPPDSCPRLPHGTSVAIADSPAGPWTRFVRTTQSDPQQKAWRTWMVLTDWLCFSAVHSTGQKFGADQPSAIHVCKRDSLARHAQDGTRRVSVLDRARL